jgi:hypothetical protein
MKQRKTKLTTTDSWSLDNGLDMPDFDFNGPEIKDDRTPLTAVKDGVISGIKDQVTNPDTIRKGVLKALPKEYGDAYKQVDAVGSSVKQLYDEAAKNLKPALKDLKRTTGRILPKVENQLPKKWADKLRQFSQNTEGSYANPSRENMRDDTIAMHLGEIFQMQQAVDKSVRTDQENRETLRQGLEQLRFRDQFQQLDEIRQNTGRLSAYQDKILVNYQRKTLELAHRQYFATVDILETTREHAGNTKDKLDAIIKNTGLPEYVKITTSERFGELSKNKVLDEIRTSLFGGATEYLSKTIENLGKVARRKVNEAIGTFSDAASTAELASASMEMAGDVNPYELGGNMAGGMAAEYGVGKLGKFARKFTKKYPGVQKGAAWLKYRMKNADHFLDDSLRPRGGFSDYDENTGEMLGPHRRALNSVKNFIGEALPSKFTNPAIQVDGLGSMHQPAIFSNATNKSIVEIIPGYLARIHREINAMRTGKDGPLLAYDFQSNAFSDRDTLARRTSKGAIDDWAKEKSKDRLEQLFALLDPDQSLDQESRSELGDRFLRMSMRNESTDSKALLRDNAWRGVSGKSSTQIRSLLQKLFRSDDQGQRDGSLEGLINQDKFADLVREIGRTAGDPRVLVQQMANVGQLDVLRRAGIIRKEGDGSQFDIDAWHRAMAGGELMQEDPQSPQARQRRRTSRVNRSHLTGGAPVNTTAPQTASQLDLKELSRPIEAIHATLKATSPLEMVKTISETALRIEQQLANGIMTLDLNDLTQETRRSLRKGLGDIKGFGANLWGKGRQAASRAKQGLLDLSMRDLAINLYGKGKDLLGQTLETSKKVVRMSTGIAGAAFNTARATASAALGKFADHFGDLYVGDELMPRMTRAKLLAGEYRDKASGNVLKSFKDIRGPVIDLDGNIILDTDDIQRAVMRTKDKLIRLATVVGKQALTLTGTAFSMARRTLGGLYGIGFDLGIKAVKGAIKLLPAYDVYVKDELEKPVLYATYMRQGDYYYSAKTGATIKHPRDIDGPVKDKDGNFVVSEEQYGKGLVNRDNRSIANLASRVAGKAMNFAGKAVGLLKKVASGGFELMGQFGRGMQEILKGTFGMVFGVKGEFLDITRAQLEMQTRIFQLLDGRLPGKRVSGDSDGDGIRDGSAEDQRRKAAQKLKDGLGKDAQKPGVANSNTGAMLSGLKKLFDGRKDEEDDGDTNIDIDLDGPEGKDEKKPKGRGKRRTPRSKLPTGKSGFGQRLMGGAGKLARGAGRGLAGAGRLAGNIGLGLLGGRATGIAGGVARGVGGAARFGGGLALRAGAAVLPAALGALGSFAGLSWGGLAAGAGALLASPVLLTGLGIAAAATAGYFAYKYLTRAQLQTLSTVRYAQYGFASDDKDHLQAIFELERLVLPAVSFDDKAPQLDEKKLDLEKWTKPFDVDPQDTNAVQSWLGWFNDRFKPVYLGHLAVLKAMTSSVSLSEIDDKFSVEDKRKYLLATAMPSGPYAVNTSPFKDLKNLAIGSYGVSAAIEIAKAELDKEAKTKKKDDKPKTAAAAAAAVAATANGQKSDMPIKAPVQDDSGLARRANALSKEDVPSRQDAGVSMTARQSVGDFIFTGQAGQLDALTTVRMKTYGLVSMDVDKVKALRRLELETATAAMSQGDGTKFEADVEQILENVKAFFGISGARSARGYDWMDWYKSRFLPVFLTFMAGLTKATGKKKLEDGIQSLKVRDALQLANVIIGTTTVQDYKRVTVWEVDKSPWDNYAVNLDPETVKLNIDYLTQAVKAVIAGEQQSTKTQQAIDRNLSTTAEQRAKDARTVVPPGQAANAPSRSPERMRTGDLTPVPQTNADGRGVSAVGDYASGQTVRHPGQGTGGDVNTLPQPTQNNYAGMKAMLDGVAKMVGVDPKALAAYVAVESNFDPNARPPIDKSTGRRASGATGLGQFVPGTWNEMIQKYGAKYGLAPGTPAEDPRANALMTAEYMRENTDSLKRFLKRDPTVTELYLAHFLGPGGVQKFLSQDPSMPAYDIMGKQAAANPSIFLDKGRPRTFNEIYSLLTKRIEKRSGGLSSVGGSMLAQTPTPTTTAAAATTPSQELAKTANTYVQTAAVAPNADTSTQPVVSKKTAPAGAAGLVADNLASRDTSVAVEDTRLPSSRTAPPANPMRDFVNQPTPTNGELQRQTEIASMAAARAFDGVTDLMKQQLATQRNAEGLLRQIASLIAAGGTLQPKAVTTADGDVNRNPADIQVERSAPQPVVSMKKRSFAT